MTDQVSHYTKDNQGTLSKRGGTAGAESKHDQTGLQTGHQAS